MTDERCLSDPYFWRTFLPLFRDEAKVEEFSRIAGIPAERIRAARWRYLFEKYAPHLFESNNTIN
jgi:hypothetical protein